MKFGHLEGEESQDLRTKTITLVFQDWIVDSGDSRSPPLSQKRELQPPQKAQMHLLNKFDDL